VRQDAANEAADAAALARGEYRAPRPRLQDNPDPFGHFGDPAAWNGTKPAPPAPHVEAAQFDMGPDSFWDNSSDEDDDATTTSAGLRSSGTTSIDETKEEGVLIETKESDEGDGVVRSTRRAYKCGRCGQPKRGHTCRLLGDVNVAVAGIPVPAIPVPATPGVPDTAALVAATSAAAAFAIATATAADTSAAADASATAMIPATTTSFSSFSSSSSTTPTTFTAAQQTAAMIANFTEQ
jgi:hypothetical protein